MTSTLHLPPCGSLRFPALAVAVLTLSLGSARGAQIDLSPLPIYPDLTVVGVLDFDSNGVAEIIATENQIGQLGAYRVDAYGRLTLLRALADTDLALRSVVAADMDGDGRVDLIGLGQSALVVFYDRGGHQLEGSVIPGSLGASLVKRVVPTDFDSDGDQDLLVYVSDEREVFSHFASDEICLLENLGGGQFSAPTTVMASPEPLRSAATIEFDQDGDLDFVAVRPLTGRLVVVRNTGARLKVVGLLHSEINIRDLAVGDVNGDGVDDVVTLRTADNWDGFGTVDVYFGNGNGTLTSPTALLVDEPDVALDITLLDVDGDGALDVALPKALPQFGGSSILVMAGDGFGGFAGPTFHGTHSGDQKLRSQVGDVNGDGRADLVHTIRRSSPQTSGIDVPVVFAGSSNAAGPFLAEASQLTASTRHDDHKAGDLDGDGVLDIVVETAGRLMVYLGTADSRFFRAPRELRMVPEGVAPLLIEDVNGDGGGDIIALSTDQSGIRTLGVILTVANVTESTFRAIGSYQGNERTLKSYDWDGDGDLDLMGVGMGSAEIQWFENQGTGLFVGPTSIPTGSPALVYSDFLVADFNGDGEPDVAAVTFDVASLFYQFHWFEGAGGGALGVGQLLPRVGSPFAVGDTNADGFDDLHYVGLTATGQRSITRASGSPVGLLVQSPDVLVSPATESLAMEFIDFEEPGRKDIVLFGRDGSIQAHESDGQGSYASVPTIVVPPSGPGSNREYSVVDVGGDGDKDVLYATSPLRSVFWFENVGLGDVGINYCGPAVTNSVGASGRVLALGSDDRALNRLHLHALDLPPLVFGFFLGSQTATPATPIASSNGEICLGGQIGRFVGPGEIQNSGYNGAIEIPGAFSLELDLANIPTPSGFVSVATGSTWSFQAWHREVTAAGVSSNLTDAVSVTF